MDIWNRFCYTFEEENQILNVWNTRIQKRYEIGCMSKGDIMEGKSTSIRVLQLPSLYRHGLIRAGIETVEELEDYYKSEDARPFSSYVEHFGAKGDFVVKDALEYYLTGEHLEKPIDLIPVSVKKKDEIRVVEMYRKLSPSKKEEVMQYLESLLEK